MASCLSRLLEQLNLLPLSSGEDSGNFIPLSILCFFSDLIFSLICTLLVTFTNCDLGISKFYMASDI